MRARAVLGRNRGGAFAIEFVDAERIQELNREHREIDAPTDVLSFGIDEDGVSAGPRELGDIVICPEHTAGLREAVVHGALHLTGMDHETDDGEMLALQAEMMRWVVTLADGGAGSRGGAQQVVRSGFVALAGRPNVGKSTLANAIVGAKVAIVSDKPQTTRRAIRGVANGPDWQLVLVDLPGVQRPRDALTERMQHRVEHELADADGCLLVAQRRAGHRPGDRFIAELLRRAAPGCRSRSPSTRSTGPTNAQTAETLHAADGARHRRPRSSRSRARTGAGRPALVDHLVALLPEGPMYFDAGQRSDQSRVGACSPSWSASRCWPAPARSFRTPSRSRCRRSSSRGRPDPDRGGSAVETESQKGILIGSAAA